MTTSVKIMSNNSFSLIILSSFLSLQDLELALSNPIPVPISQSGDTEPPFISPPETNLLVELIIKLLKGYFNNHKIGHDNWEQYLKKIFDILWVSKLGLKSPFLVPDIDPENGVRIEKSVSLNDLNLKQRSEVLYHLCELRLYNDDSSDVVANLVEDELRIPEPLGVDSKGNNYWYFFGTRLYRENPEAVKKVELRFVALEKYHEKKLQERRERIINEILNSRKDDDDLSVKEEEAKKEPVRKRPKREFIPGERSSSRNRKAVDRLTINGTDSTPSTDKKGSRKEKPEASRTEKTEASRGKREKPSQSKRESEVEPDPSSSCGVPLSELTEAWTCICDTEEDWIKLAESLKRSKSTPEVKLYNLLSKNFLPRVHEVFQELERIRQRETRQKLLELVPRRESSRIQTKKAQQEEEEKRAAEEAEARKRFASQAEERRKREVERKEQEQMKRDREVRAKHRLAIMEDRAARAALRRREQQGALPSQASNMDSNSPSNSYPTGDSDSDECGPLEFFVSDGNPRSE